MNVELAAIEEVTKHQVENFRESTLCRRLPSFVILQDQVEVVLVQSPRIYRGFTAKVTDNPKTER